jgi:AraC family transcriptional regulator, exoenzyme S synthesis regulatory protein ExsA
MLNLQDFISGDDAIKRFNVDDLLFAEYKCIVEDSKLAVWWHNNYFSFVVRGEMIWKTPIKEYTVKPGELYFVKKGAFIAQSHVVNEYCDILIFVPDEFVKNVVEKYKLKIIPNEVKDSKSDIVMPLQTDDVLDSYFHSLLTLFQQAAPPSGSLLRIKFEELIVSIITRQSNSPVKDHFRQLCLRSKVSIQEIMEANFFNGLSLEEFSRLCSRSLTAFKREFKTIYNVSPGKWLQEKRLEYSRFLLETTADSIDEVFFNSGFKNSSHFIRAFKNKYGITPGKFRSMNKV